MLPYCQRGVKVPKVPFFSERLRWLKKKIRKVNKTV